MFVSATTTAVFPTYVWLFELAPDEAGPLNARMIEAINDLTGPRPPKQGALRSQQTSQDLHRYRVLQPMVAVMEAALALVLDDLQCRERRLAITGCWANFGEPGSAHMPHHHANNYLSGVYYLAAPEGGDRITFHDPRPQRDIIEPIYQAENAFNRRDQDVGVRAGSVVVFPSWLTHSVKPNKSRS
ncbi:MAG: TIGR02466 family protein, partial [Alphaproteobacteria bacterium]